ncbi:MAG: methyltransferase domain-containing protein [Bryobacteraceae bacterium]
MKVHNETLSDVVRYLDSKKNLTLEDMRADYESYLRVVRQFAGLTPQTRILEIGTGTGWFPLLCKLDGLTCKGLEISPQLVEHAHELGRKYGVEPDIELGNIEECALAADQFDAIIANSVFEHIERWPNALQRIHRTLKPGGMFFFISTNKFSFKSYEYDFPFYGWLPDAWRYRLRVSRQGPDIMKLGIDFNQFTYPGLRRVFRKTGFSRIYDRVQVMDSSRFSGLKRIAAGVLKTVPPVKGAYLLFTDATLFVCIK